MQKHIRHSIFECIVGTTIQKKYRNWYLRFEGLFFNIEGFRDTESFLLSRIKSIGEGDPQFEDEIMDLMSECFYEHNEFFDACTESDLACTEKSCEIHVRFYKLAGCFKNIGAPRLAHILETAETVFACKSSCKDIRLAKQFFKQVLTREKSRTHLSKAMKEWLEFSTRVDEYKTLRSFHRNVYAIPMSAIEVDTSMVCLIQNVWKYWSNKL